MSLNEASTHRRYWAYGIRALMAIAIFAGLAYAVGSTHLWEKIAQADVRYVVLGTLVFIAGQYLAAQRWRALLMSMNVFLSRWKSFQFNTVAAFAGLFLPGMGSGDLVKCSLLFSAYPGRRLDLIASSVMDRLIGLTGVVLMALIGAAFIGLMLGDWQPAAWGVGFAVAGGGGLICAILVGRAITERWKTNRFVQLLLRFAEALKFLSRNPPFLIYLLIQSLIFQLSWAVCLWCMLRAVMPEAPLWPVLCAAPVSVLIAAVPVSLGGLGVREGAFSLLMLQFGVVPALSMSAALLSLLPLFISAGIGAVFLLISHSHGLPLKAP